jgi:N-acetylmuramoyl-L-alanine amidase
MTRLLLIGLLLFLAIPVKAATLEVGAVRFGLHPGKTRFVLELSQEPSYRVFTLADPFRVVIDMPEFTWKIAQGDTPRAGGVIKAMRYGLFAPGTGRIVLDTAQPVRLDKVFVLPPGGGKPHRFVIDVTAISRSAYFATAARLPITSKIPLPAPKSTASPVVPVSPATDDRPMVIVDAGHGGVDPGARGLSGISEKALTLDYAKALKRVLQQSGRYRVFLTRNRDRFIKLRDRVRIAQEAGGDLFVSLHANIHKSPKVSGASIFTLSEKASDAEAEALAAAENSADVLAGIDLGGQTDDVREILIDLAQRETMNLSKQFANTLVREVAKEARVLRNSHRFAGFAVLKSPTVPSILFEIGYLSNQREERLMRTEEHRKKIVTAMLRAIDAYFLKQKSASRS